MGVPGVAGVRDYASGARERCLTRPFTKKLEGSIKSGGKPNQGENISDIDVCRCSFARLFGVVSFPAFKQKWPSIQL
jgi:hypothetical protein